LVVAGRGDAFQDLLDHLSDVECAGRIGGAQGVDAEIEECGHGEVLDKRRAEISPHMRAGFGTLLAFDAPGELEKAMGASMNSHTFYEATAAGAAAVSDAAAIWSEAKAQARNETLLIVGESTPNSMYIHGVGANRPAYEVSWNTHDRLIPYGVKKDGNGNDHYDYTKLEPELATEWNLTPTSVTFNLRRDAKFHDGTPITAKDVKWSFDRAVTVGGFPTFQMAAGSLQKPEQFVVVDDHTFRVDF